MAMTRFPCNHGGMSLTVRAAATVDDVLTAADLFDDAPTSESVATFLDAPGHHLFIAYWDGQPAGFVSGVEMCHPDKGLELFVYELGVDERFRRRGVASALLSALAQCATELGATTLWTATEPDNAAAVATYARVGAAQDETKPSSSPGRPRADHRAGTCEVALAGMIRSPPGVPTGQPMWKVGQMTTLPIFPLGSVLLPGMPLHLQLFEPRYLTMLSDMESDERSFGVVLIERGFEVGGGDQRFGSGTVAEIEQTRHGSHGRVRLTARGGRRFEVEQWLPDDPYPRAEIRFRPELEWSDEHSDQLAEVQQAVLQALVLVSGFGRRRWHPGVDLSDDPVTAAWQLAGIAPLGEIDQLTLLRSTTVSELLDNTERLTNEALELLLMRLRNTGGDEPSPE